MTRESTSFRLSSATGPSGITRHTSSVTTPKAYEVLVRIHAVSLNFRDFAIATGLYPLPVKKEPVMGSDMAGEVVEVGDNVTEWKKGDRVTANFDQENLYGPQMNWNSEWMECSSATEHFSCIALHHCFTVLATLHPSLLFLANITSCIQAT